MITFSNLGQYGRLGNQFYQYALAKSVATKLGYELCLPDLSNKSWHGQRCQLPMFNLKYSPLTSPPTNTFFESKPGQFDPRVFDVPPGTDFNGFFQNIKYFDEYKSILAEEFTAVKPVVDHAELILSKFNNPTSIHIRRGDYLPNACKDYNKHVLDYINAAMEDVGDSDFIVFTGGSRNGNNDRNSDFQWCKDNIKGDRVFFAEGNPEVLDFELIKRCKNNITGWDSTFSWWASYLNEKGGRIYCNRSKQKMGLYNQTSSWIIL